MVLSDKGSDEQKSERRSRASSPNGNLSDDSTGSNDSEYDSGMRVGREYQAPIPDLIIDSEFVPERALLVWSPSDGIPDGKLDEYISIAKEKFGYNAEQALGMLFWHKHDLAKAISDLPNFTPYPDEWTVEDKVLYEQAFQFHGKSFVRIHQMLPDKPIASLVKYYYSWKKTRSRTSLMDRQAKKLMVHKDDGSDAGSEFGSGSDSEDVKSKSNNKDESGKGNCSNCNVVTSQLYSTPKASLCNTCYQYWRRTGLMRSAGGSKRYESTASAHRHNPMKSKQKPPRGMYLNCDDLMSIAASPISQGDAILKQMDIDVVSLKRQVQNNKQIISQIRHKTSMGIDSIRPADVTPRTNARWSNEELLYAVQGVRKYGKNFKAIAEVIGNKTEAHVRNFFINYRRRYNLDAVLRDYKIENGTISDDESDEKTEVDNSDSASQKSSVSSPLAMNGNGSNGNPPTTISSLNNKNSHLLSKSKTPQLIATNGNNSTLHMQRNTPSIINN
ncbi:REST corepressor 3 [Nymphon striatum]|nr:REST corepressor 3 [Nymphon striatum]